MSDCGDCDCGDTDGCCEVCCSEGCCGDDCCTGDDCCGDDCCTGADCCTCCNDCECCECNNCFCCCWRNDPVSNVFCINLCWGSPNVDVPVHNHAMTSAFNTPVVPPKEEKKKNPEDEPITEQPGLCSKPPLSDTEEPAQEPQ